MYYAYASRKSHFSPTQHKKDQTFTLVLPMNPKDGANRFGIGSEIFGSEAISSSSLSSLSIPRPMEVSAVPAFLSKTFDIVDDAGTDHVVSWSPEGASFVVLDPQEFSRLVLPRNFKHNNFSSFVRQLNTYGFRKIDPDKWEFANELFLRGKRNLLKNIQRRKSPQSQPISGWNEPLGGPARSGLEMEVDKLKDEKSSLIQEVIELKHQNRGTARLVERVNERLQSAEQKQKQMVSFFVKMVQKPSFIAKLKQQAERDETTRARRRFVTQRPHHGSENEQNMRIGSEDDNTLLKGKGIVDNNPDYYVSSPGDLAEERSFSELSSSEIREEGIWETGFDSRAGMPGVGIGNEFLDGQVGCEELDLEMVNEMLDIWDFSSDSASLLLENETAIDEALRDDEPDTTTHP